MYFRISGYKLPFIVCYSLFVFVNLVVTQIDKKYQSATYHGDIILGGLFPVHDTETEFCKKINPDRGIQRLEAMLFTIQEINNRQDILPNINIGARILDTCSKDTYALQQSLDFIKSSLSANNDASDYYCRDKSEVLRHTKASQKIRTVVGGSYSSVSILVANLLRLFNIPQISYASTSAILSDKRYHPVFARTLPSDLQQAKGMAILVAKFNWTYVSTVRSSGDYGDSGIDAFWKESKKLGVCIAAKEMIKPNPSNSDLLGIVKTLYQEFSKTRVVVLFTRLDHTKLLLNAVKIMNYTNHFLWIASDGWGKEHGPVTNNSNVANGALTFEVKSVEIKNFTTYFHQLTYNNPNNPWFSEYWEEQFDCIPETHLIRTSRSANRSLLKQSDNFYQFTSNVTNKLFYGENIIYRSDRVVRSNSRRARKKPCSLFNLSNKLKTFKQESKIQSVYDAVYAVAYTLNRFQEKLCKPFIFEKCVKALNNIDGLEFYKDLINNSFIDSYGNLVKFDSNGDSVGQYNIYNYIRNKTTGKYYYKNIGEFRQDSLYFTSDVTWPGEDEERPRSICSEDCKLGEIRIYNKESKCCWKCDSCKNNEYVINETKCEMCSEGEWPYQNRTGCFLLTVHYMKLNSWFAIIPMILSFLGTATTSSVIGVFYYYKNTPIVRASGRELSFLILSGCLVCYLVSFCFLLKPTIISCATQRILLGLGFAVMYASLLTKTNRIARIFESAQKTAKRPPCISPKSQLMICAALISVQLLSNAIWLFFSPPGIRYDRKKPEYPVLKCKIETNTFLVSLVYNMLLISVCTYYAIKTRKIPENFNESKFIGFAMYTTCVIWLAFITIYFGTLHSFEVQLSTLGISVSLSAWVTLVCLFFPKLHIIFLQPEKNVRKLTMSSTTYRKPTNSSGSFANHREMNSEYTPLPPPFNAPAHHLVVVSIQSHSPSINEPSTGGSVISNVHLTNSFNKSQSQSKLIIKDSNFNEIIQSPFKTEPSSLSSIPSPNLMYLEDEFCVQRRSDCSDYFSSIKDIQEHLNSQIYVSENGHDSPFSQRRVKFPEKKTVILDFSQQNITSL